MAGEASDLPPASQLYLVIGSNIAPPPHSTSFFQKKHQTVIKVQVVYFACGISLRHRYQVLACRSAEEPVSWLVPVQTGKNLFVQRKKKEERVPYDIS